MKKKTTTVIENQGNKKTTTITEETFPINETTQLAAVLDRSGSMNDNDFIYAAISKFNEFMNKQKALPGKATASIFLFDDVYEVVCDGIDIQDVKPMTIEVWKPRSMTRLFDAVGKTITTIEQTHSKMKPEDVPAKVLVVILTDGLENDSKEFTGDAIKKLIAEKEAKNWNFIFLGANQDAFATASRMGMSYGNTMSISNTAQGAGVYTASLDFAATSYRGMSVNSSNFQKMSKSLMNEPENNIEEEK